MISKFNLLLVLLVVTIGSLAQTKTYLGFKAGTHSRSTFINHTIFNISHNSTFTPGFHAGFIVKHFPKYRKYVFINHGIQGSINYVQKGWVQLFVDKSRYKITMGYFEVPFEGVLYFGNTNKYFVTLGGYFEILADVKADAKPDLERIAPSDFVTYRSERDHKVGYGGRISGGIFRDFSFGSIHLEGFFTYSFSNLFDAGDLTNELPPDISNHWVLGGSIGFLIPFGKLKIDR